MKRFAHGWSFKTLVVGLVLFGGIACTPVFADTWPSIGDPRQVLPAKAAAEAADTITRADHYPRIRDYDKAASLYHQAANAYELARIELTHASCPDGSEVCRQQQTDAALLERAVEKLRRYAAQMQTLARDHEMRGLL